MYMDLLASNQKYKIILINLYFSGTFFSILLFNHYNV